MRTLNRRLLRWRRYARRTCWRVSPPAWIRTHAGPRSALLITPGHTRAWNAMQAERERRLYAAYDPYPGGECCCAGCIGMGPCENEPEYDDRCCLAGDLSHPGPCVTRCTWCGGDGRCPACGGQLDSCSECGGDGYCGFCDEGEVVEDDWIAPRPIVTVDTGGLT